MKRTALKPCWRSAAALAGLLAIHTFARPDEASSDASLSHVRATGTVLVTRSQLRSDMELAANTGRALVMASRTDAERGWLAVAAPIATPDADGHDALRTFALVDPMLVPDALEQLPHGTAVRQLVIPGLGDQDSAAVLPYLIELPEEDRQREQIARLTVGWARTQQGAAWVLSRHAIDTLAVILGRVMDVRDADDLPALLRLADARVLDSLQNVLEPVQWEALLGSVEQWRYVDREGHLRTLEAMSPPDRSDERAPEGLKGPLALSHRQEAQLQEAALPDEVLHIVGQQSPGRLDQMSVPDRYAFAVAQIKQARTLGIESSRDIGLFAAMAVTAGADFFNRSPWVAAIHQAQRGERTWRQALSREELRQ